MEHFLSKHWKWIKMQIKCKCAPWEGTNLWNFPKYFRQLVSVTNPSICDGFALIDVGEVLDSPLLRDCEFKGFIIKWLIRNYKTKSKSWNWGRGGGSFDLFAEIFNFYVREVPSITIGSEWLKWFSSFTREFYVLFIAFVITYQPLELSLSFGHLQGWTRSGFGENPTSTPNCPRRVPRPLPRVTTSTITNSSSNNVAVALEGSVPFSPKSNSSFSKAATWPTRDPTPWWKSSWWRWRVSLPESFGCGFKTKGAKTKRKCRWVKIR